MKIFYNDLRIGAVPDCWPVADFDLYIDLYEIDQNGNQKLLKSWQKDENSVSRLPGSATLVLSDVPLTDGKKYFMTHLMESNVCDNCCSTCTPQPAGPGGKQRWHKTTGPFIGQQGGIIDGDLMPKACKCC